MSFSLYTALSVLMFAVAAGILLFLSARNLVWNGDKEQARENRLHSVGISRSIRREAGLTLLLGLAVTLGAPYVYWGSAWRVLGILLIVFWAILILLSILGNFPREPDRIDLDPQIRDQRVRTKRIAGLALLFGAIVWLYSGYRSVI